LKTCRSTARRLRPRKCHASQTSHSVSACTGRKFIRNAEHRFANCWKRKTEKEHFPKELWDVIDPKGESGNPDARKKTLKINTKSARDKLADFDEDDEVGDEADGEAAEKKNPEDDEVEELEDDEFDEDENDDMADDYNGEKYFEDGEEDYDEGGGGGDDDGDGY
jgi:hypothetical protein